MTDGNMESALHMHRAMFHLREPAILAAIRKLDLSAGGCGLDAGCGTGLITELLSQAVAPGGHVTGLDLSPQYVAVARERIGGAGLARQVTFREGDVNALPFEDDCFDWAWSMDTLWPGPQELGCPSDTPFSMVRELTRVVRPGGTLALLFWSAQKLLPGHPLLEARLGATSGATAPFRPGMRPDQHFLRGFAWLRDAGLQNREAHTFVAGVQAPLSPKIRQALLFCFPMFWAEVEAEVRPEDWAEYQRLCQPDSRDLILNDPDYCAFLTYTMFYGRKAT